jgi:hypothetical protein
MGAALRCWLQTGWHTTAFAAQVREIVMLQCDSSFHGRARPLHCEAIHLKGQK